MRAAGRERGHGSPGPAVPRRHRRPAVRLAAAVLLAATVVAVGEGALAAHLSARATLAELVTRLSADARSLPEATSAGEDPAEVARGVAVLDRLRSRESLDDVTVLARDGRVLLRPDGASGGSDPAAGQQAAVDARAATAAGRAVTSVRGEEITITVPDARGRRVLRVSLDAEVLRARAARTRTPLLAVIGLGALICLPLTFVAGGTRLVRDLRRSRHAELTDPSTGLANSRALAEDVPAAVEAAGERTRPLGLVLVEVNGLTAVTDADGQTAADALRAACARVLSDAATHAGGRAYRLDDGRWAVLGTLDVVGAAQTADRIRAEVAAVASPLSADAAGAVLDHRCPDAESLLIGAEQALAAARERRALVELFAAMSTHLTASSPGSAGGRATTWVRLPEGDGTTTASGSEGPDPETDIWDLDWFDDRP